MKKIIAFLITFTGLALIGCDNTSNQKENLKFKISSASVEFKENSTSSNSQISISNKAKRSAEREEATSTDQSTGVYAEYITWETWTFSSEYDEEKWNDVIYEDKTPVTNSTQITMITGIARTIITTYTLNDILYYNDNTGAHTPIGFIPSQCMIFESGDTYTYYVVEGTVHLSDGSTIKSSYLGSILIYTRETHRSRTSLYDQLERRYAGQPVVDDGRDQLTLSIEIDPSLIKK